MASELRGREHGCSAKNCIRGQLVHTQYHSPLPPFVSIMPVSFWNGTGRLTSPYILARIHLPHSSHSSEDLFQMSTAIEQEPYAYSSRRERLFPVRFSTLLYLQSFTMDNLEEGASAPSPKTDPGFQSQHRSRRSRPQFIASIRTYPR